MNKIKKSKTLEIILVIFVAFNLAFYPAYPAIAQEATGGTEPAEEPIEETVEEETAPEEETTEIETGDAEAITVSESDVNKNVVDPDAAPTGDEAALTDSGIMPAGPDPALTGTEGESGQTEDLICDCESLNLNSPESTEGEENTEGTEGEEEINTETEGEENPCIPECEGALVQENSAEDVSNAAEAVADTGENSIMGNAEESSNDTDEDAPAEENTPVQENILTETVADGGAAIDSGDAAAGVVAVNEINTNIVAENSVTLVENITGDCDEDINLLEVFNTLLDDAQELNDQNAEAIEVSIVNINKAVDVENTASTKANSGENTIENVDGDASIITGAAQAAASVVNIINTNIVGNNWLFAIINVLGNWTGNLIVPGEGLLSTSAAEMIFGKIVNVNEASNIQNSVSASANTGGNSISESGEANIETGDAVAGVSATNLVNTNITRNNWFFLMINNSGTWMGRIVNWNGEGQTNVYEYNFGSLGNEVCQENGPITNVFSYNQATNVSNTVTASANTGGNTIKNADGASIATGNAGAWASAFNLVNTNIVGNNWFFAMVNNAGNWNGNVVFAYPDMAVSVDDGKDFVNPGEELNYQINLDNSGQAEAKNVKLALNFPGKLKYISDTSGLFPSVGAGGYFWDFSNFGVGEKKSFSVKFKVDETEISNPETLEVEVSADTDTKEVNFGNNSSQDETRLENEENFENGENNQSSNYDYSAELSISRESNSGETVNPGEIVKNSIWIKNSGDSDLYDIEVVDKMKNQNGEDLGFFSWPIDHMPAGKSATIEYEIMITDPGQPLTIVSSVSAEAKDEGDNDVKSRKLSSVFSILIPTAFAAEEGMMQNGSDNPIENSIPSGQVLGATDEKNKETLPLWIWLAALLAYYLAVNWSFFPKKEEH